MSAHASRRVKEEGFYPTTKVIMSDGRPKALIHIRVGDEVLCLSSESGPESKSSFVSRVFAVERVVGTLYTLSASDGYGAKHHIGIDTSLRLVEKSSPVISKTATGWTVLWYENGGKCIKFFKGLDGVAEITARYFFDTIKYGVVSSRRLTVRDYLALDEKTRSRLRGTRGKSFVGYETHSVPQDPYEYGVSVSSTYSSPYTSPYSSAGDSGEAKSGNQIVISGPYTRNSIEVRLAVAKGILSTGKVRRKGKVMVVSGIYIVQDLCFLLRSVGVYCAVTKNQGKVGHPKPRKMFIDLNSYLLYDLERKTPIAEDTPATSKSRKGKKSVAITHREKNTFKIKIELSGKGLLCYPLLGGDFKFLLEDFTII